MTHFWNFWDPLIAQERLKLETSNLAQRWTTVSVDKKCKIWSEWSTYVGSRDQLLEFCDPLISRERLKPETSNLVQRWMAVNTNEKMQN